jgi:DNA uptake protein ComE-like DNA-binding protein
MRVIRPMFIAAALLLGFTAQAQVGNHPGLLDANLAERAALLEVPGINAAIADAIIGARPVLTLSDLDDALSGLLDAEARTELYRHVARQINLNSASREEIMLIPGMSARMAHEFEEYRPYTSLEQFRREIGKYVDAAEVARLEQYVFVPMDLNSASGEAFLTIPGMSNRMVHEFEEYRPYTSVEQFRREIGKYVDADEVARLESYVTID